MKSEKGSNWCKCDLHIHTPASFTHHYGDAQIEETWDKFIADLNALPPEFKVIGINDYLTLDGYKKVKAYADNGKLEKIKCILPVIEFRINKFAGDKHLSRINYHIIFSDKINIDTIQTQFLNALSANYTLESGSADPDWSAIPTYNSLSELGVKIKAKSPLNVQLQNISDWKVGFNNFNVDYEKLKEILNRPFFKGRIITAIGKGEWDNFRWDSGGASDKRSIINEAKIVFLAGESADHCNLAKAKLKMENVNHLLFDCSDAHNFSASEDKDRIGNCDTWLKIEPSFNGLKQVLFEQEERVRISATHPDKKAPYQVIDYVQFQNGRSYFSKDPIYFSSGLNSIIGGKSTGKSLLAGLIVKSSDSSEYIRRKGDAKNDLSWLHEVEPGLDFDVYWKDGNKTSLKNSTESRKITYFPQHYLNSKINDGSIENKELNRLIRSILSQTKVIADTFLEYEKNINDLDSLIAVDTNNFETKIRDIQKAELALSEKGNSEDIQKNIDKLNKELSDLKEQFDLSEKELLQHREFTETLKSLNTEKDILIGDIFLLDTLNKSELEPLLSLSAILGSKYSELSEDTKQEIYSKILLETELYLKAVKHAIVDHTAVKEKLKTGIENKATLINIEHAPILEKINDSSPLRDKSELIRNEVDKLEEVKLIELKILSLNKDIELIENKLMSHIANKISSTNLVKDVVDNNALAGQDDQLKINVAHKCKSKNITAIMKDRIKYQSNYEVKGFLSDENFNDDCIELYQTRVNFLLAQAKTGKLELKGDNKLSNVLHEILSNSVYLNYDLKLGGDSFNIMSPGKRALALLRVLVELDKSQHPIVLDQPEDDLDNRSVYEGLAEYLKKKKKDRQIIVVTHNPNVVVGADSEYVIVANQSGQETNRDNKEFQFEYKFGGLENSFVNNDSPYVLERIGIREHVCEILDGGEKAFEKREKLYSN